MPASVKTWIFSGLGSPSLMLMPPRLFMPVAPAPPSATTQVAPAKVASVAWALWMVTTMPSSDSKKSAPSWVGSKLVK